MATRATIGFYNGGVKAVYSHWDGYPTEMGRNLAKFFPTRKDAEDIELMLGEALRLKHFGVWFN